MGDKKGWARRHVDRQMPHFLCPNMFIAVTPCKGLIFLEYLENELNYEFVCIEQSFKT